MDGETDCTSSPVIFPLTASSKEGNKISYKSQYRTNVFVSNCWRAPQARCTLFNFKNFIMQRCSKLGVYGISTSWVH